MVSALNSQHVVGRTLINSRELNAYFALNSNKNIVLELFSNIRNFAKRTQFFPMESMPLRFSGANGPGILCSLGTGPATQAEPWLVAIAARQGSLVLGKMKGRPKPPQVPSKCPEQFDITFPSTIASKISVGRANHRRARSSLL